MHKNKKRHLRDFTPKINLGYEDLKSLRSRGDYLIPSRYIPMIADNRSLAYIYRTIEEKVKGKPE